MWKGLLIFVALGASPTDQPIQTTGWAPTYTDRTVCEAAVATKAKELNKIYATAGITGTWKSVCYQ